MNEEHFKYLLLKEFYENTGSNLIRAAIIYATSAFFVLAFMASLPERIFYKGANGVLIFGVVLFFYVILKSIFKVYIRMIEEKLLITEKMGVNTLEDTITVQKKIMLISDANYDYKIHNYLFEYRRSLKKIVELEKIVKDKKVRIEILTRSHGKDNE